MQNEKEGIQLLYETDTNLESPIKFKTQKKELWRLELGINLKHVF